MKLKVVVGLMLTLCLMFTLFGGVPVRSQYVGTVKIGVMGPMAWVHGRTMREAATIAVDEIMAAGGIVTPAGAHDVELVFADTLRGKPDPDAETGVAAAMELVAAGCDFVLGGYRTEATLPAREVLMDAAATYDKPIYWVAGASTDEIIDCGGVYNYPLLAKGVHCGKCVRDNYDRYKYTFRVTPMNSTTLNTAIGAFNQLYAMQKVLPLYGVLTKPPTGIQVRFALITEALRWCDAMHMKLTIPAIYQVFLGPYANLSYQTRCSPVETEFSSIVNAIKASKAHLIVEIISGPAGRAFVTACRDGGFDGMIVGIDVPGQEIPTHWDLTDGKCEYETFLTTMGSGQPASAAALHLYTENMARYGHAPIYTAYGIYDGIRGIKELIEGKYWTVDGSAPDGQSISGHPYSGVGKWPMTATEMVPIIEITYRPHGILGIFKNHGPQVENRTAWGTAPPNFMFAPILEDGNTTEADAYADGIAAYRAYWDAQGLPYDIRNVNPNATGSLHDLYVDENYGMWFKGYSRALVGQWQHWPGQDPKLEVIVPTYRIPSQAGGPPGISKKYQTDPFCYRLGETDITGHPNEPGYPGWPAFWDNINPGFPHLAFPKPFMWPDGKVFGEDILVGVGSWQAGSGDFLYECRADMNGDDFINILDLAAVGMDYNKTAYDQISMWFGTGGTRNPDA